jgi:hypothetical protein
MTQTPTQTPTPTTSTPDMADTPKPTGHSARCNGPKRQGGGLCTQPAGWGTPHPGVGRCRFHLGCTPSHVTAGQKALAEQAVRTYGAPRRIDPREGLIEEYWRTAGAVAWLEGIVAALEPDDVVWGKTEEVDKQAGEFGGTDVKRAATINVWVRLYGEERDRFSKLGLEIIKLGLEARRDEWVSRQGTRLYALFGRLTQRLLEALPQALTLDPAQRAALDGLAASLPARLFSEEVGRLAAGGSVVEGKVK